MKKTVSKVSASLARVVDFVYPIGAIYMSVENTSPEVLFGGTWNRISDRFLLASGSDHAAGSIGGAANVTLDISNLPSHVHSVAAHAHGLGSHTHTIADYYASSIGSSNVNTSSTTINFSNGWGLFCIPVTGYYNGIFAGTTTSTGATTTAFTANRTTEYHELFAGGMSSNSDKTTTTRATTLTGSQAHTHTLNNHTHTVNNTSATRTTDASTGSTADSTAFNSGSAGGGKSVNNMPPYIVVNAWERIA